MANLFIDKAEAGRMRLLMRYLTAAERANNKPLADLHKAQAERRKQEREQAAMEGLAAMYRQPAAEPVGFVSQPDAHPTQFTPDSISNASNYMPEFTLTAAAASRAANVAQV